MLDSPKSWIGRHRWRAWLAFGALLFGWIAWSDVHEALTNTTGFGDDWILWTWAVFAAGFAFYALKAMLRQRIACPGCGRHVWASTHKCMGCGYRIAAGHPGPEIGSTIQ